MTTNAQWWVTFQVTTPDGRLRTEMVSLASPDLVDTKEAHRRARETARTRLLRKLEKDLKSSAARKVQVLCTSVRCVG
jgi:tetraacyldisaccharide-1-P 4'-kinase